MVGDTIYISEQGESIIKQDFLSDTAPIGAHTEYAQENASFDGEFIKFLQEQVKELTAVIKIQAESLSKFQNSKIQKRGKSNFVRKKVTAKKSGSPFLRLLNRGRGL
jgi:hypothetical protein